MEDSRESFSQYPQESSSLEDLVQNAMIHFENKFTSLENEIHYKTQSIADLDEKCQIQARNILNITSDLEHHRIKIYNEVSQRESCNSKVRVLQEKSQELSKYFEEWTKGINIMLPATDVLKQFVKLLKDRNKFEQASLDQCQQKQTKALELAMQILKNLEEAKENEKNEFAEIRKQLEGQFKLNNQAVKEMTIKLQNLNIDCRDKNTVITILESQNEKYQAEHKKVQNELELEGKRAEASNTELQASLQKEIEKKENLTAKIAATDKMIQEINHNLRESENEIKTSDLQLKELIIEKEELAKNFEMEQGTLNELNMKQESMVEQLNKLREIDEENEVLNVRYLNLEKTNNGYKKNIDDIDKVAISRNIEIEELNELLKQIEGERRDLIKDGLLIEDQIKDLQNKITDNSIENNKLSLEIERPFAALTNEQESLNKNLDDMAEALLDVTKDKEALKKVVSNLKVELERARYISEECDSKLFTFLDKRQNICLDMKENSFALEEMVSKSTREAEKAKRDSEMNEQIKDQIKKLEDEIKYQQEVFAGNIKKTQEYQASQIEIKKKSLEDIRVKYDREYRNKEQLKTDALVEFKENKVRLSDLKDQIINVENEIKKKQNNLIKCDSLLKKLECKISKVFHMATADSQSITDHCSQTTNLFHTPHIVKKDQKMYSPESNSTAQTYDPDDFKLQRKRKITRVPQNILKGPLETKKHFLLRSEKSNKIEEKDDWGF